VTVAHENVLWVMAYDDYPIDSIYAKQKWQERTRNEEMWFVFYHDANYRAMKWDDEGRELSSLKVK
jgi:hypothetical protein